MKNIDLKEQDIKNIGIDHGPIYFPFDEDENRKIVYSKDISKNQLAFLYDKLYSAYLNLYYENKKLREDAESNNKLEELNDEHSDSKFEIYINELIDKRIKEKLSFDKRSEAYSGCYATLEYCDTELGSVCLKSYYED